MAHSIFTPAAGRHRSRRFYRWRLCRFEPLEVRQVLSASLGTDALSELGLSAVPQLVVKGQQTAGPTGYTPAQLRQAYGFNSVTLPGGKTANGSGTTIAIVDAGNDPTIVSDLAAFDKQFGIAAPPSFKVVNQNGSSNVSTLPIDDPYVSVETSLDVEWAHAIAPGANILLVESDDILAAVNYARSAPGVDVVSISYGIGYPFELGLSEFIGQNLEDTVFTTPSGHQGVSFTVSAGDTGGPAQWPSTSPNVLSVGGTTLTLTKTNSYSSETVWNNAIGAGGGGLSGVIYAQPMTGLTYISSASPLPLEPAPNYQASLGFTTRATPDVSYDADPNTGFAVYDSFAFGSATPWEEIGGTSAGAPQWAALIAIADQGRTLEGKSSLANVQSVIYKLPSTDFHDITTGNNDLLGELLPGQGFGLGVGGNAARLGYDLASGRGTPIANLVIRDLVAYNGSTIVTLARVTSSVQGTVTSFNFVKAKSMTADGGSDGGALVISSNADGSDDSSTTADDSSSLNQLSVAGDSADLAVLPTSSLRLSDSTSLQFASDWQDDGSSLSHHSHGIHDTGADYSDAALDNIFAEI